MLASHEVAVEETRLPRYARYRGRVVRLIAYSSKTDSRPAYFVIIDTHDHRRNVRREDLTFLRARSR